jgi:hypothetical protein
MDDGMFLSWYRRGRAESSQSAAPTRSIKDFLQSAKHAECVRKFFSRGTLDLVGFGGIYSERCWVSGVREVRGGQRGIGGQEPGDRPGRGRGAAG